MARDAYMYAQDEDQSKELEKIVEATRTVGLPAEFVEHMPFPASFVKVAKFGGQAQFHPTRYITGLAKAFQAGGGTVVQGCRATDVEAKEDALNVITERGLLRARHVVYATHVPPGVNILTSAMHRTALRAFRGLKRRRITRHCPTGGPYYRTEVIDGVPLLIAGGCDHKTGHAEDTTAHFRELEAHLRSLFPVESITHQWSSQYFEPADGLPYIGHLPMADDRIFVATGYNGTDHLGTFLQVLPT